jgi:putative ABC transport system ATP-binding protein
MAETDGRAAADTARVFQTDGAAPPPRVLRGPPVVRVQHLNHWFGQGEARKQVLVDNCLELMPGEIVIMTGPSGSGKTTLLTLIGALRTVQDGEVEILGHKLHGRNDKELVEVRRSIGFIFQAHNLFGSLTAYQNVRMALELNAVNASTRDKRIVEVLTQLGLRERINYKPWQLSGGQKQRVAIARALANRPKVILADEPTAALDKQSGREVVNLLQQLAREEGCTSLIVTHDNRILDVADRIVNMVDGRIISNVLVEESVVICEFLSKCPVFSSLPLSALSNVASQMKRESFEAGQVVIRQGDEGDKFYLIREGSVDVTQVTDGQTIHLATLKTGDFFGEIALMADVKRTATVTAREDLETYTLGKAEFLAVQESSATFKEEMRKVFFQRQ